MAHCTHLDGNRHEAALRASSPFNHSCQHQLVLRTTRDDAAGAIGAMAMSLWCLGLTKQLLIQMPRIR